LLSKIPDYRERKACPGARSKKTLIKTKNKIMSIKKEIEKEDVS
jgi:hypothetical protein